MKLSLKVLKKYLLEVEEMCKVEGVDNFIEWINNNISDEEVSVKEWLELFSNYWKEVSDDYGDSEILLDILVNSYNLSEDECDSIMCEYWCDGDMDEYRKGYKYVYNDYVRLKS